MSAAGGPGPPAERAVTIRPSRSFLMSGSRERTGKHAPERPTSAIGPQGTRRPVLPVDFDAIFEDVFPSLLRYCHRLTGDADTAEDVTQEAFVRLLTGDVEGTPAGLRAWLFRVATHLARDRYRVSENRRRLLEAHPVAPAPFPDPDRGIEREEAIAEVRAALDALPERDRTMLLMREEGFSYREIAEAVGVQAASVGTLLARAQRRFAEAYEGEGSRER